MASFSLSWLLASAGKRLRLLLLCSCLAASAGKVVVGSIRFMSLLGQFGRVRRAVLLPPRPVDQKQEEGKDIGAGGGNNAEVIYCGCVQWQAALGKGKP